MPDLTLARATAESTFDSRCLIRRDTEGASDDLFDEATLTFSAPVNDAATVYLGPCLIRPSRSQQMRIEGDAVQALDLYDVRLPVAAEAVAPGDIAYIVDAPNDPSITNQPFTVLEVSAGSYAVTRMLKVQRRQRGPRT